MSQVWLRGPVCGVDNCRSRLYRLSAGRKFCQFGHVMDGNYEFDDDDGDNYTQTKRLKISLTDTGFGSSTARADFLKVARSRERLFGREARLLLLRCLQMVLRDMIPEVVELLYPEESAESMRELKAAVTQTTKYFWVKIVEPSAKGRTLRLSELPFIIFLAIRQTNLRPLYIEDLIVLLTQNRITAISASKTLPAELTQHLSSAFLNLLTTRRLPVADGFYKQMAKVALRLAPSSYWAFPGAHFLPMAFRLFSDLHLDAPTLTVMFHRLISRVPMKFYNYVFFDWKIPGFPEFRLIGFFHLVIKLYFVGSSHVVDTDLWVQWLDSQKSSLPCFDSQVHKMSEKELLDMSVAKTDEYCNWVYDNLLTDKHNEENVAPHVARLYKILDIPERIDVFAESDEIPYERTEVTATINPPFDLVTNELNVHQIVDIEKSISRYLCWRYGLKSSTLRDLVQRAELGLYRMLQDDSLTHLYD